ncbi:MORN repeat-containing protein [Pandoraea pneumonica]
MKISTVTRSCGAAIGLLMLLLCHSAAAADGAWINDAKGCRFWSSDPPMPAITWTATWTGACKSGFGDGDGTLVWFRNGVFDQQFDGVLTQGKRSGTGTYRWANGNRYEGVFVDDARTGKGKFFFNFGVRYEGDFVAGKMTGQGIMYFTNGDRYEGGLVDGAYSGHGTIYHANGSNYSGNFLRGGIDSNGGVLTAADGTRRFIPSYTPPRPAPAVAPPPDTSANVAPDNGPSVLSTVLGALAQGVTQGAAMRPAAPARVAAPALPAASNLALAAARPAPAPAPRPVVAPVAVPVATTPPAIRNHPENDAISCIHTRRGNQGNFGYGMEMVNDCGYTVEIAWCAMINGNTSSCARGFDSMNTLGPGQAWPVDALAGKEVVEVKFGACKGPNGLQEVNINNPKMTISCGPYPN